MPDGLYDRDILAWAGQQAALLRRVAAGEEPHAAIDWANVIDEVQDVGLTELRACESRLARAIEHLLTLHAIPRHRARRAWRHEALISLTEAERHFAPSMAGRIDLQRDYRRAVRAFRGGWPEVEAEFPAECPFELPELLSEDTSIADLLAKLRRPA